jgi:type IX secretion system PorP/SprF family membrane protein
VWFKAEDVNPGTPTVGTSSNYTTPTLFLDANFGLGFSAGDWTSFGLTIVSDKAGDGQISNSSYMLNAAYHWSLDKNRRNVLTFGAQYGRNTLSFDPNEFRTESWFQTGDLDPIQFQPGGNPSTFDLDKVESFNMNDVNAGITLVSKIGKTNTLEIGVAAGHLLPSKYKFATNDSIASVENKIDMRINAHAQYTFLAGDGIALAPVIYFSSMGGATNIQAQLNSAFRLNEKTALTAGLGYRFGDAAQLLLGMNYGTWKVGIGYDQTISSASDANSGLGAFELGISKIIFWNKKPKIDPILLCPRL